MSTKQKNKVKPQQIIDFWFEEINRAKWFDKDPQFDQLLKDRFLETLQRAKVGELHGWRDTIEGRLAEIIVLDQFSRNIFRDKPEAFDQDNLALILSQEALKAASLDDLEKSKKAFLIMPFMHSESPKIHQKSLELFTELDYGDYLHYEKLHKNIIDRFGRYPHRNQVLGRDSTAEEIEFLKQPNSSF